MRRIDNSSRFWVLCVLVAVASWAHAQPKIPPLPEGPASPPKVIDHYPQKPSLPVSFSIPLGPLGFAIPGDRYLLRKQSLVSLDFLAEDRLLFTFRVSGLMEREAEDNSDGEKQQIRAIVLSLPDGKVESEAGWVVPDRLRYLWMLNDGRFLLRLRDGLDVGDTELKLSTYLRPKGRLLWIQMDPKQEVIITNSIEPASGSKSSSRPRDSFPKSDPPASSDLSDSSEHRVLVARTLKRSSGEVIRVSRVPWTSQTVDWPLNSEGYLESSKESGGEWLLNLNYFRGGKRAWMHIDSTCAPKYDFISDSALLISRCDPESGWKVARMSTDGKLQWERKAATNAIWPLTVVSRDGSRVARETLLLKRSAYRYKRLLGAKDLQGQMVRVFDVGDGRVVLEAPLTPIFDGGGNVAISPSGRRVATLNAGAIQVFELPTSSRAAGGITP